MSKCCECKHCMSNGECTLFECYCDHIGYCGVKNDTE